ncbi:hypothetical protein [Marivita geojedonensis]|uniref:Uncharacterized protein n=1 Tax=Marivita geojedonensis TaxID=1123756 RepID=A0A1X4NIU5_9RHOB|nr:hypothetical protein [Marivita geojedonensis]OSQ48553.1 hypothetical protein MGEO_14325 [Marivita geojedonensis]PRY75092.1 hypothetical protein CLV76_1162 [Marivita geojedonensis]
MNQHADIKIPMSHRYHPTREPRNEIATILCDLFLEEFSFPRSGKRGKSYTIAVASLLYACQTSHGRVGVARKAAAWSQYPLVGKDIGPRVIDAFAQRGFITLVPDTGTVGFYQDDMDQWKANPTLSVYDVNTAAFPKDLADARFMEATCELVQVNVIESRQQRAYREAHGYRKKRLTKKVARERFGDDFRAAQVRVEQQNQYWSDHPLVFPNGDAACCATRIFHDESLISGGRLYGMWTNMSGPERRQATIDGEPVVEIDIRGSQPTLLNSLLGYKLNGLSPSGTWFDVYTQITGLTFYYEDMDKAREVAKGVCMDLIGSGNPQKRSPSRDLKKNTGVTQEDFEHFRDAMLKAIPGLNDMEPRFDDRGDVSGYINGAGYLPFHESEMILQTLEALRDQNVPAYPVHDSLIVKESDVVVAAQTLRGTICNYCEQQSGLRVMVPITVKDTGGLRIDLLHEDDRKGYYP